MPNFNGTERTHLKRKFINTNHIKKNYRIMIENNSNDSSVVLVDQQSLPIKLFLPNSKKLVIILTISMYVTVIPLHLKFIIPIKK